MTEENEHEEDDDSGSGTRKRLSEVEFASARDLYELGKAGIADLARDFGVTRQTLSRRFRDVGAVKGSRAHEVATAAAQAQKAVVENFAAQRATMIEETRMAGLSALKQTRLIGQKIVVEQMKKPGGRLGEVDDDLKALGRFNKILIDNLNTSLGILNADEHIDEEDLPILRVEDLTDQDILDHHISTGALEEDATLDDINSELS